MNFLQHHLGTFSIFHYKTYKSSLTVLSRMVILDRLLPFMYKKQNINTLSEAWSVVNLEDLMAARGAFGTDFYDRSTRTIVGTMLWTEYRPVIKIDPKGALGSHMRSAQFTPLQALDRV